MDLDEKIGLEKLKEKVKVKMERIRRLRATPSTKGLLIKARVISVINYTASVQKVEEKELEKWEKEIYGIMVKGYGKRRKDMVYEKEVKGGNGMPNVCEEYKVNRIRGLTQMTEMADRQEGRGQVPWIQKKK